MAVKERKTIGQGAVVIGAASSRKNDTQPRWTEVEILRAARGRYVVREIGRSSRAGEEQRERMNTCTTGSDVLAALTIGTSGKLSHTAYAALESATAADTSFAALVQEELPIDLTPRAEGAIVIDRDEGRPLRFAGELVGSASSRIAESHEWIDYQLYLLSDDRYLIATDHVGRNGRLSRTITLAHDGATIVAGCTQPGRGWVDGTLLDVLEQARKRVPALHAEIGVQRTVEWAHDIVGSVELRIGDGRYAVLTYLVTTDARIVSVDRDGDDPTVLGFIRPSSRKRRVADAPTITPALFMALSRQSLIWRDYEAERAGLWRTLPRESVKAIIDVERSVAIWRASPKGVEVLAKANER